MGNNTKVVKETEFSPFDFIVLADKDYLTARLLTFAGKPMWRGAVYHSHQAIEKYLKALLVQDNASYLESHKLIELASLAGEKNSSIKNEEFMKLLEIFDQPEQITRYGPFANYDPSAVSIPGKYKTKDVFTWTDKNIIALDKAVYTARSLIDFDTNENADNLGVILQDKNTYFVSGWKLPGISLKDILISHNDYFIKKRHREST